MENNKFQWNYGEILFDSHGRTIDKLFQTRFEFVCTQRGPMRSNTRGNMEQSNREATSMSRMELFYEVDSEHICKYWFISS